MRIYFKCGCFVYIYQDKIGEQMGLACCKKHEKPNAKIENIGLIEVERVVIERPFGKLNKKEIIELLRDCLKNFKLPKGFSERQKKLATKLSTQPK